VAAPAWKHNVDKPGAATEGRPYSYAKQA
jgi:hypothetical protein